MEPLTWTLFDFIVIGLIAISGLIAFFKGFIQETLSLLLWVFAFAASININEYLDTYFSDYINNPEIRRMVLVIIAFIIIIFLGGFLIKLIASLVKWSGMGGLDKLLGVIFGFLRGIVLILIIYIVLPNDLKQSTLFESSKSNYYLKKYAPITENFFKKMIYKKNSVMLYIDTSKVYEIS